MNRFEPVLTGYLGSCHNRQPVAVAVRRNLAEKPDRTGLPDTSYEMKFEVPNVKSQMEWSLIGGRGAISPFHADSDGLGTVVVVLEGSKYWILETRLGEHDEICSNDSFGPGWNPYVLNEGDNAERFHFEGVHLQKGNML